jgi:hypothetical protein
MAHYAELAADNRVIRVIVIPNEVEPTEEEGIAYCEQLFGGGIWRKTSYNATIRKNFAGTGYSYDIFRDAFIPPQPFPSWLFDDATCRWNPPTPMPDDGKYYRWDEYSQTWVELA